MQKGLTKQDPLLKNHSFSISLSSNHIERGWLIECVETILITKLKLSISGTHLRQHWRIGMLHEPVKICFCMDGLNERAEQHQY